MTKSEARSVYLKKRKALSENEVVLRSKSVCEIFFNTTDLTNVRVIHLFLPIKKNNEPDTWLIIERIKSDYPNIRISIPKVNIETSTLNHYYLTAFDSIAENTWGIPELYTGEETLLSDIDLILVPLLVFDTNGNRVGYGKGFYDRFLSKCKPEAIRTGLSLFEPIEQIDDVDAYDEPLHRCITPMHYYDF